MITYTNDTTNRLIAALPRHLFDPNDRYHNGPIALDAKRIPEYIALGWYTREFVDYFLSYPYAEDKTDKYAFRIRRQDELIKLYIWKL